MAGEGRAILAGAAGLPAGLFVTHLIPYRWLSALSALIKLDHVSHQQHAAHGTQRCGLYVHVGRHHFYFVVAVTVGAAGLFVTHPLSTLSAARRQRRA
jgi:hypothetical protein